LPDQDPFEFLEQAWNAASPRDLISRASLADLVTYLPCDLMTKVDIASMAHGLECRQPFLDYRLVEWAAALPSHLKYRWGGGKRLLRDAFGRLLPRQIWTRKKMGFGVPLGSWFQGELRSITEQRLLGSDARCHQYFRPDILRRIVNEHMSGQVNQGYRLWNLLFFESWLRVWQT
jgi:asparagine synthase (glutamine-hydrolysing)